MNTKAMGRLLRLAAVVGMAGVAVGCAGPQSPTAMTAPPGFGKDDASRVERLVQYCDRLVEKGELVTALGLCGRAHEIDPNRPEPLLKVAAILQTLERKKAAATTYEALLQRHPKHHEARYLLGKLYMETGEAALAGIHFEQATRSDPQDPRPYNALGILRDQAGEHEAAQGLYRLALERDPANRSVRNNLGLSLALDGKRDEAIEVLAELAVDPEADQTVLRNLEAAYAARPLPQDGMPAEAGAESAAPLAAPVEPVASEPLPLPAAEGGLPPAADATIVDPAANAAIRKRAPAGRPADADVGEPTPLYLPPAAGKPQQESGARQPEGAPGPVASGGAAGSAILAAAERLMRPPEWADFEPGSLISAEPVAETPAPQNNVPEEIMLEEVRLDLPQPESVSLSMLLLDDGMASA